MTGYIGRGPGEGRSSEFSFTASGGQSAFGGLDNYGLTLKYVPGFFIPWINGRKINKANYTATDGSTVTFAFGLQAGDQVDFWCLSVFSAADGLSKAQNLADVTDKIAARSVLPNPGTLFGLNMSTAGSSTTLTIAAGFAADSTNVKLMRLVSAMAKTTAAWAIGTAAGGLDTGTIAVNTWYHFYVIYNPTTDATDVVFSTNATTPTLPAGYTLYRRIGSMRTETAATNWLAFFQDGDTFHWYTPIIDFSAFAATTTSALYALSVPLGVRTTALFRALFGNTAGGSLFLWQSPNETIQAANTPAGNGNMRTDTAGAYTSSNFAILTDTSRQVRGVASVLSGNQIWTNTYGWIDSRGKNG